MGTIVKTEELTKRFADFTAVDHVNFKLDAGEVVGLLGPNGSGKTTTIRMLLGLLLPSEGWAKVLGFDAERQSEKVRAHVGYMSQKFALYHELTVLENLTFYAGVYSVHDRAHLDRILAQVGLSGLENERVSELSTGWRQRLALGTAIAHSPQLLFLDEPTSGVDPTARRAFWDLIYELVEGGVTAFVTTHYMDEAEYCTRVGIMNNGRLLAIDTPSTLKKEALPGTAWDIFLTDIKGGAEALLSGLESLNRQPGVLRAGLAGDHLRAITQTDLNAGELKRALKTVDLKGVRIKPAEASLEDVFLALAAP